MMSASATRQKNNAVCQGTMPSRRASRPLLNSTKGEALGDVIANKPDHHRAGIIVNTPAAASSDQSIPATE